MSEELELQNHWLFDAEQDQQKKKSYTESAGFLDRKMRIKKNYEANKDDYESFIELLSGLIDRVNSLPLDKREPFGHIDTIVKETKLENRTINYRTSQRFEKLLTSKMFDRLLNFDLLNLNKPSNFKHIRTLYVSVSSKMGMIGLELKEEVQLKQKVVVDEDLVEEKDFFKDKNRLHDYFNWEIDKLDQKFALKIIDWLAFKCESKDLPFFREKIRY